MDDFLTDTVTDATGNTSEFSRTIDFTGHLTPHLIRAEPGVISCNSGLRETAGVMAELI